MKKHPTKTQARYIVCLAGCLTAIGQRSGNANRASRAKPAIWHNRAHCSRAIWHLAGSGKSGKMHNLGSRVAHHLQIRDFRAIGQLQGNRAIGQRKQSGASDNRASHVNFLWRACPDYALCQTCQITRFARLARLLNWPDYSIAREAVVYQIADGQIGPDCYSDTPAI